MIWYLCVLMLIQAAPQATLRPGQVPTTQPTRPPAGAVQAPTTQPAQTPPTPAPTYDQGPLRVELLAMFDARYRFLEEMEGARKSELSFRWRVQGQRIDEVVRAGDIIFTQAVDSTGAALIGPETYTPEQKTGTKPLNRPADQLRANGLITMSQIGSPAREAKAITLKGSVKLVLGRALQDVTIDNPLEHLGKTVENERLAQLGVTVKILGPEELQTEVLPAQPASRLLGVQYLRGQDKVQSLTLYDGWMKPLRHRERQMKTQQGEPAVGAVLQGAELNADSQLVLHVFTEVQDVELPVELKDLALP